MKKEWNIRDYGAICSDRLQTEKIQKAIDDCWLAGGGRVRIPKREFGKWMIHRMLKQEETADGID